MAPVIYATRQELIDAIKAGFTKQDMIDKFGYTSIHGLNGTLRKKFKTVRLELIAADATLIPSGEVIEKKKKSPMERYWSNMPKLDKRTMGELFENPIAAQDFRSGAGYNRIEEIWAKEGLA